MYNKDSICISFSAIRKEDEKRLQKLGEKKTKRTLKYKIF